jgi:hypothetical protein
MSDSMRRPKFDVANVATATSAIGNALDPASTVKLTTTVNIAPITQKQLDPVTNIQLAFWKDAKEKYQRVKKVAYPDPADLLLIIAALGFSLTFLFGVNFTSTTGYGKTPSLANLVRRWKLHKRRPDLYRAFDELAAFFTSNIRHASQTKIRSTVESLTMSKVQHFMNTAQELWKWFIGEYYNNYGNGIIPGGHLDEFNKTF